MECLFIFKCSYKLLPLPLSSLASEIKENKNFFPYNFASKKTLYYLGECPKREFFNNDESYNYFKEKIFDFKKEAINYCFKDVFLLQEIIFNIIKTLKSLSNNKNNYVSLFLKSNSIPSFSNKIFYKYYNKYNIEKKIKLEDYSYIKDSYFGGRCEIFGNPRNDEVIHYFDFSGMYGQCMLEKFPIEIPQFNLKPDKVKNPGFYYIKFTQNQNIPCLPIRKDNKLLFSNGNLEGLYWYEEIDLFLKYGGELKEILYSIEYQKEAHVFEDFINDFNKIRGLGGYKKILGKLIINSLYGSFGLKKEEVFMKITYSENEFYDILENLNVKDYTKINNCYLIEIFKDKKSEKIINKEEKNWSTEFHERNVAYASIITAKARIKLYESFMNVQEEEGRLLYCDTDSIFAAFKNNNLNKKCGKEVIWSEIYEDACFMLPKFYILKDKKKEIFKSKGVKNTELSLNELKNLFYSGEENLKIKNEILFYKKNFELKQKSIDKLIWLNKYDKRKFSYDKKETSPYNFF